MIRDKLTNDRGQVGIGTLIVFIALVLVAAIAAGVLINTAGFLQTQAEQTGEDSSDQVANNINIIGEVGIVGEDDIEAARLTVQRSPGSDDVDLTELSIQYVGDNGFGNYIHTSEGEDGDNEYLVEEITAESDDAVMTDDSDRYQIVIPFQDDDGDMENLDAQDVDDDTEHSADGPSDANVEINENLDTGDEAELEITTADRATRNAFIQVPDTIGDDETEVTL